MRWAVALAAASAVGGVGGPAAAQERLPAACGGEHLWFVIERARPVPRIELRHADGEQTPHLGRSLPLIAPPEAMAARGAQVWLLMPPDPVEPNDPTPRRPAFMVQVERDPVLGGWSLHPPDRLRVVPPLDGAGRLVGFVGADRGPIALLGPDPAWARRAPQSTVPILKQLRGTAWETLPLPALDGRVVGLGSAGSDIERLALLSESTEGGRLTVHWRHEDESWSAPTDLEVAPGELLGTVTVGDNIGLLLTPAAGRIAIDYLRPTRLLELANLPRPDGRWVIVGRGGGLERLEQTADGEVVISRIDGLTGQVGPTLTMSPQPVVTSRYLHRPLLFALAITGLMLVLLFRPNSRAGEVRLPPELSVAPAPARLLAVLIDLAVSGAVVVLVTRCTLLELLALPMWTVDLASSVPYLMMTGVTVLHSTGSELVWRRTLGKVLCGVRVAGLDGAPPRPAAILVRNGFKALVLLIPVLAVFALLSPHLQGLGDSMARTVVVRPSSAPAGGKGNDR